MGRLWEMWLIELRHPDLEGAIFPRKKEKEIASTTTDGKLGEAPFTGFMREKIVFLWSGVYMVFITMVTAWP
jgi:hypothetical protein